MWFLHYILKAWGNEDSSGYKNFKVRLCQMTWKAFKSLTIIEIDQTDVLKKTDILHFQKTQSWLHSQRFELKSRKRDKHKPRDISTHCERILWMSSYNMIQWQKLTMTDEKVQLQNWIASISSWSAAKKVFQNLHSQIGP